MNKLLHETWTQVQRAETSLVLTSAYSNRQRHRNILADVPLDRESLTLLIRTAFALNQNGFRPQDYLVRYPFSSVAAIRAGLEKLVEAGYVAQTGDNDFAPNDAGKRIVNHWMSESGKLMHQLDLGATTNDKVQKLLDYDHRIVEGLTNSERPHGNPILNNRLQGVHPQYKPRQLWHHWQLVLTMIAAREDEEEFIRQTRQIDPLVWFARRQIWFADRRPWLARALTFDRLLNRAVGYSPIENAAEVLTAAVHALKEKGWLRDEGDEYRLTSDGLAAHDADEDELISNFLARWPAFTQEEVKELHTIASGLNEHLAELQSQLQTN
jgi:hypothetical protein